MTEAEELEQLELLELAELEAAEAKTNKKSTTMDLLKGVGSNVGNALAETGKYLTGAARTATMANPGTRALYLQAASLANNEGFVTDLKKLLTQKDPLQKIQKTLQGDAPSWKEHREEAGITGDMPVMDFAADAVVDPTTLALGGVTKAVQASSKMPALAKVLGFLNKPLAKPIDAVGAKVAFTSPAKVAKYGLPTAGAAVGGAVGGGPGAAVGGYAGQKLQETLALPQSSNALLNAGVNISESAKNPWFNAVLKQAGIRVLDEEPKKEK